MKKYKAWAMCSGFIHFIIFTLDEIVISSYIP